MHDRITVTPQVTVIDVLYIKFYYWSPRPENAVQDQVIDPTWKPYLPTPTFPSYVSGHAGYSAAAAQVLSHVFPNDAPTFAERAREAAMSRLYGGIHYRFDNDDGLVIGEKVGRAVVERLKGDGADRPGG